MTVTAYALLLSLIGNGVLLYLYLAAPMVDAFQQRQLAREFRLRLENAQLRQGIAEGHLKEASLGENMNYHVAQARSQLIGKGD